MITYFKSKQLFQRYSQGNELSIKNGIPLEVMPHDTLILLDSPWDIFDDFLNVFRQIQQRGGKVFTGVHDFDSPTKS